MLQNRDVWVGDLLWAALRLNKPQADDPWIIAGDFNLCETFNSWKGGTKGEIAEYLDRMDKLGLVDCLRFAKGGLTPTFRRLNGGTVTAQIDYLSWSLKSCVRAWLPAIRARANVCLKAG